MKIKTLENKLVETNIEHIYIKPFFKEKKVAAYGICSNENNVEIVLGTYTSKMITQHMLHLIKLCRKRENYNVETEMLTEEELAENIWLMTSKKLNKLRDSYIERSKRRERLYSK